MWITHTKPETEPTMTGEQLVEAAGQRGVFLRAMRERVETLEAQVKDLEKKLSEARGKNMRAERDAACRAEFVDFVRHNYTAFDFGWED